MIRHLIKLIWNKKRSNFLLTTEIFASFLVLFGVLSLIIYNANKYGQPLGYNYENVWRLAYGQQELRDSAFSAALDRSRKAVVQHGEVAAASRCTWNTPYAQGFMGGSVNHGDRSIHSSFISTDEHYADVLDIEIREGRWFEAADVATSGRVVVLNRQAREQLFGEEPALGKSVLLNGDETRPWKVIGLTGNFKTEGEYQLENPVIFFNHTAASHLTADALLVRVNPSADAAFEAALLKELSGITKGASIELSYLSDQRRQAHNLVKVPMLIAAVVCGFLLLNVGLGLFGVLWFNIRKRRAEIGLRRALGATQGSILGQFVGEAVVIAGFGALVGLFFVLQFPLLGVFGLDSMIYFKAVGLSLLVLFTLVAVCALYPSREATTVRPAMVLHEE